MTAMNEVAAQIMEHLCNHAAHGYTWGNRWGEGGTEKVWVDGKAYTINLGDRDCSSAVISAYKAAGLNIDATYTGNMRQAFLNTGMFEWKPMSFTAQRGDIYLNEELHTAMCVSVIPDLLAEFTINEFGECYGGQVGDQTGTESYIHGYYNRPWDGILHFKGGNTNTITTSPVSQSTALRPNKVSHPSKKNGQPLYNAMVNSMWLDTMQGLVDTGGSGDDYAGEIGIAIQYLAIEDVGSYQVCSQASGWLETVSKRKLTDLEYGAAGDGSAILAVRIHNDGIEYRTHTLGGGWLGWMRGLKDISDPNETDDFAGEMLPIDAIQIRKAGTSGK